MAYDLLIRNGRVVDGSGMPAFWGDVGVSAGKITDVGKLGGPARRVIDAGGQAIAPGFIDIHCHYDAQVIWDPLCTFSCYHGATTVINGNCSLGLAPVRPDDRYAVVSMLSKVEQIPIESLQAGLEWSWETIPEYLDTLDRRLGVNVGPLIGFSAVRRYVMGEDAYTEQATDEQINRMKEIVREGVRAGALGVSFVKNPIFTDLEGRLVPCNIASNDEWVAVAQALAEVGSGTIQYAGRRDTEMKVRLARETGRAVVCNQGEMDDSLLEGARLYPCTNGFDTDPAAQTLTNPHVMPGNADSGAHVTTRCDSHVLTHLLSHWVRGTQAMTLEEGIRKMTSMPAAAFGLYDRGLIRPGLAADLVVFDPDSVSPGGLDEVADLPGGAERKRRLCTGVEYTIVNGEVLIEEGEHTGAFPGRVARSSAYHASAA